MPTIMWFHHLLMFLVILIGTPSMTFAATATSWGSSSCECLPEASLESYMAKVNWTSTTSTQRCKAVNTSISSTLQSIPAAAAGSICLPLDYGRGCAAHDEGTDRAVSAEAGRQPFCYVDPRTCTISRHVSDFFGDDVPSLAYSFLTCGGQDLYTYANVLKVGSQCMRRGELDIHSSLRRFLESALSTTRSSTVYVHSSISSLSLSSLFWKPLLCPNSPFHISDSLLEIAI